MFMKIFTCILFSHGLLEASFLNSLINGQTSVWEDTERRPVFLSPHFHCTSAFLFIEIISILCENFFTNLRYYSSSILKDDKIIYSKVGMKLKGQNSSQGLKPWDIYTFTKKNSVHKNLNSNILWGEEMWQRHHWHFGIQLHEQMSLLKSNIFL